MIKKYEIESTAIDQFLSDNLNGTNLLSNLTLETLRNKKGVFYTYLSEGLTKSEIHDFLSGGKTKNNRKDVGKILYDYLRLKKASCIFDDVNTRPNELNQSFISKNSVFICENEVYYLTSTSISLDEVLRYLDYSSAIWHSLVVVIEKSLKTPEKPDMGRDCLQFFSENASLVLMQAYDAESYIFWERSPVIKA